MKKIMLIILSSLLFTLCVPALSFAGKIEGQIDTGNTAFIVICSALVFLMTPALAFFYGGLVRKKNVLNTMMSSLFMIGLISVQWVLIGYTLSFGDNPGGFFGGLEFLGFNGVTGEPNPTFSDSIPHSAFAMFQLMFAIITPALISGAFAERIRFSAFIIFAGLWATFVYNPLCHMVWGGGFLGELGAIDFAGGTVVHISSGIAGLVGAIYLGKRKGYTKSPIIPHNVPFVLLGAGILWFGWFGFNAGSALAADGIALNAFVTTNTAGAAALLSWVAIEWIKHKKPTIIGAATGAVVGLVAITPAAGFVTPLAAIIIGLTVSPVCLFAVSYIKVKFGYDDSLDAFGCHGVGGIWGAISTGLFATTAVNSGGANGLFYGDPSLLLKQFIAIGVTIVLSGVGTIVILKVTSLFVPLRVDEKNEDEGLDLSLHGEDAYPDIITEQSFSA